MQNDGRVLPLVSWKFWFLMYVNWWAHTTSCTCITSTLKRQNIGIPQAVCFGLSLCLCVSSVRACLCTLLRSCSERRIWNNSKGTEKEKLINPKTI